MAPESRVRTGTFRDVQARCDVRARAEHEPLSRPVAAASGGRLALLPNDRRCRGRCHCRSFYVDVHTEAVQAALAKYKERKVPLPSKRRSALAHPSVETCTPPGTVAAPGGPTGRPAHRCHAVVSCRGGRSWPVGKIWKNRRGRRVSECGSLTRGPSPRLRCGLSCVHRGAVCVRLLVRGRPSSGRAPRAQGFARFSPRELPLPGGPQASGGGADAARRGSGLLLLLPCPRDTPRGVSWHRPHAPGPGQTACGTPPRPGVSLGSQTW